MIRVISILHAVAIATALSMKSQKNMFFSMSSTISLTPNIQQESGAFSIPKGKYMSAAPSNRWQMGRKLTVANRKHSDMGVKLRSQYLKLRLLSPEEEIVAGKFSQLGKKLEKYRSSLITSMGREPSDDEWAESCRLSESSLRMYIVLSQKARHRLVGHNMRLVDFWVRRFLENTKAAKDVSYYELLTEGVRGLTEAANNYDGRRRFAYYAQFYIRGAICRGLTALKPGSHSTYRSVILNIKAIKIKDELTRILNRKPTMEEIAEKMNMGVSTYKAIRAAANKKVISMETPLNGLKSGDVNTYLDLYLTTNQENTHSRDMMLWKNDFREVLNCLTPTERRTVAIRFGLMDGKMRTIETTAELMCLSDEGTRFIIARALNKLRNSSGAQVLEEGLPLAPITTTSGRIGAMMY